MLARISLFHYLTSFFPYFIMLAIGGLFIFFIMRLRKNQNLGNAGSAVIFFIGIGIIAVLAAFLTVLFENSDFYQSMLY